MKRISRRNFLKAAGVSAAALGLAACGGSSSSTASSTASSAAASAPAADVTIKVAAIETGYGADMWKKVTEAFTAQTGIKVELTTDKKLEDVIGPSMQGGDYPDVVHLATGREAALTEQFIKGNLITGWQHIIEPEYKMDYDPATKTYTYTHEFFDFDEFMFYSLNGDSILDGLGPVSIKFGQVDVENSTEFILGSKEFDSNFTTGANGTYTFTYSLETRVCVVTYDPTFTLEYVPNTEWYIVGGGCSELLSISDWGRKNMDERFKLMPVEGKEREYGIRSSTAPPTLRIPATSSAKSPVTTPSPSPSAMSPSVMTFSPGSATATFSPSPSRRSTFTTSSTPTTTGNRP